MHKPQAVVFDLGKVLLEFDYARVARNMAAHCGVTEDEIVRLLNQSPLLHRYETGLLTSAEFFEEVRRASKFCRSFEDFEPLFADIFTPIPEMIELHAALRRSGIPVFIFSNTSEIATRHIRRAYPFFSNFDGYIYSFEHRSMKPDPKIYEAVEQAAGQTGAGILYIDDRLENILQARQRRWQTIHHTTPAETIKQVRAAGLIPP